MQRSQHTQWLCSCLALCLTCIWFGSLHAQSQNKSPAAGTRPATNQAPRTVNRNNSNTNPTPASVRPNNVPLTPNKLPQVRNEGTRSAAQSPAAIAAKQTGTATKDVGPFTLQHRLKPGQIVRTKTTHVANTVTRIQGTEDISESKSISDKVWEVKSVSPDGLMTFEYRIDAVDMSQKQGDKSQISYNSRNDKEAPQIFSQVAETIAKPIADVTIDATGTVIERDSISKIPALGMPGMGELAIPLPKESVDLGAQWSIPRECRVKLDDGTYKAIKIREQYTLEKVSAGVATIRIHSQPITPVDEPSVEAQLMQQMSEGTLKFDIDQGRLISKQLDWDDEVVGFRGDESSVKYTARFTEELVPEPTQAASRPAKNNRK
jgi:hypothetical protein